MRALRMGGLGFSSEDKPTEAEVRRARVEAADRAGWQEIPR